MSLSNLPAAENEAEAQFVRVLYAYSNALINAIVGLREMCGALYEKSQGRLGSYSKAKYDSDLKRYNALVQRYSDIGQMLSAYFNR